MSDNVEFNKLKRKLGKTSSESEKIKILEELLKLNPRFPFLAQQKKKYRSQLDALYMKKRHKKRQNILYNPYDIKKAGPQIALIGAANSGKSTLLSILADAEPEIAEYPYTTFTPEIGTMEYKDINFQIIEVPPIYENDSIRDKRKYTFIKGVDEVIIVLKEPGELNMVLLELCNQNIEVVRKQVINKAEKSGFIVYRNNKPDTELPCVHIEESEAILEQIYIGLNIIRVYTKTNQVNYPPLIFDKNKKVTVKDLIHRLGRDFSERFNHAKIWGTGVEYDGQEVSLDHELADGNVIKLI